MVEKYRNKTVKVLTTTAAVLTAAVMLVNSLADLIEIFINDED